MNRNEIMAKGARKTDLRMPLALNMQEMLTGYLSPEMHKNLRLLPSARKRKTQP